MPTKKSPQNKVQARPAARGSHGHGHVASTKKERLRRDLEKRRQDAFESIADAVADLKKAVSAFGKDMVGVVENIKSIEARIERLKETPSEPVKVIIPEPREEVTLFPGKFCQNCKKERSTTRHRSIYMKNYEGPCGDSFCYASCEMTSCRAVDVIVCDECARALAKPGTSGAPLR